VDPSSLAEREWCAEIPGTHSAATGPGSQAQSSFGAHFGAQLEPLLSGDCVPDPLFFVESWTIGAAAAAEHLRRRQRKHETKEPHPPAFPALHSLPPFLASAEWLQATTISLSQHSAPAAGLNETREEDEGSNLLTSPHTLEGACRLLGVAASSSRDQIKGAYRQLAGRCHPDRHATQSGQERQLATERMASINEAYRLLCAARKDSPA